jgi:hypothetical protein
VQVTQKPENHKNNFVRTKKRNEQENKKFLARQMARETLWGKIVKT